MRAVYRLQLGPGMGFAQARELVPYLSELGVSHLYLSPSLQARSGSTHGYDVIDPTRVSDDLGGEQGLRELAAAGLPIILDIVPNHMGIPPNGDDATATGDANRWWSDPLLRERFFDIDPVTGRHRRFFDVDDMAGVRQEDPEVFAVTHGKVLELLADGVIVGLRIDHVDGLADPAGYLHGLRAAGAEHVWVEKILHPGEPLRDWPVEGTVGYEFLNEATALFVDQAGERLLDALWSGLSDDPRAFAQVALDSQLELAQSTFAPEVERLDRVAPRFGAKSLAQALASLPVYRAYVEPADGVVVDADREVVRASDAGPELAAALLLEQREGIPDEFVTRFQQTSPAITAKGVEDTAFYRYLRLLALNEVGGDPGRFGISVDAFHAANAERALRFPRGLLCTQTHDTKRSGDARARIGALAGVADEWARRVEHWRELTASLRTAQGGPDPVDEYLVFQTLVALFPAEPDRLDAFLIKALREARRNTSWMAPDLRWEEQVRDYARGLLEHGPFVEDFAAFMVGLLPAAEHSALGQLLLKLTCPGVPDIFQGDELWRLSLVDPDNRRAVDWEERRRALTAVRGAAVADAAEPKLALIVRTLALRARRAGAFAGAYEPVNAGERVCAFLRGEQEVLVVTALRSPGADAPAPAGVLRLSAAARGRWRDLLGDGAEHVIGAETPIDELPGAQLGLWLLERA